ncbi:hypothetical protein Btru_032888 [Bulinus truncatus]|nr:hypothetical protein Btru_032888 [Bulinus truncatus]
MSGDLGVYGAIQRVMTLDESIGTTEQSILPEIKFKSTLSYAERLMLKKHRRTELAEMPSPRSGGSSHTMEPALSRSQFSSTFSAKSDPLLHNRRQDSVLEGNDHIDFQSLFEAVKSAETPEIQLPSNYSVSPDSSDSSEIFHQPAFKKSVYVVKEVSPLESWKLENNIESESLGKSSKAMKNKKPKLTRHTNITEMFTPDTDRPVSSMSGDSELIKSSRHKPKSSNVITPVSSTSDLVKDNRSEDLNSAVPLKASEKEECAEKRRPSSKLGKSQLGKKSRPASRAESRANSRISLKGHLTGSSNEALKKVAQMTNLPQYSHIYYSPMEQFFLAGVNVAEQNQDSPRKQTKEDQRSKSRSEKVSNRLYQMAPKSWRPDSSLGEMIPLSNIKVDENSEAMTLAYSYSGSITGKAAEWRPSSSQSRVPPVSPDLDIPNGLMFGDEMFTLEAAQVAKTAVRVPSAPRSGTPSRRLHHSKNFDLDAKIKNNTAAITLHPDKIRKSSSASSSGVSLKSSAPPTPKNDLGRQHNASPSQSQIKTDKKKSSAGESLEISKSQSIKPANSAISRAKQSNPGVEHSQLNQKSNKDVKTNLRKPPPENVSSSDKPFQASNSGKTQGRSSLVSKSTTKPIKNARNVLNRSESDHRPLSSTNVPQVSQGSSNKTQMRPNSSSGPSEPLRKTQPSLYIKNPATPENTVIADMMMSRVQEDNWVAGQHKDDSSTDSEIFDYDDGDDIGLTLTSLQRTKSSAGGDQHWETEIRPFSGVSLASKGANTPFTGKDNNRIKRPISSRPMSMLSGRESKAIVIDGDDLSSYDNVDVTHQQDMEDKQALDQLEWELASDTGRLTADGQISRMSLYELKEDSETSSRSISEQDYDVAAKLFEDERNAEKEVDVNLTRGSVALDEDEVRALR